MNKIILIDKEKDYTSRDVVNILCKQLKTKKVGHTGTLDPLATGVLPICVGKYTKLVNLITSYDKVYETKVVLGMKTDTLDISGNVIEDKEYALNEKLLKEVLLKMKTTYMQEVPIYSAVKVNGKKLYEYARNNIEVILPKREVVISQLDLLEITTYNNKPAFIIKTKVSKGTYIRALIDDIAKMLNTCATMVELRRLEVGKFKIENCEKLTEDANYKSLSILDVIDDIKVVKVNDDKKVEILNGKILDDEYFEKLVLFVDSSNNELAIYKPYEKEENKIKPYVMLLDK